MVRLSAFNTATGETKSRTMKSGLPANQYVIALKRMSDQIRQGWTGESIETTVEEERNAREE